MPQFLEVRDIVCVAMRQANNEMDDAGGDNGSGDGIGELQALFAQLKALVDQIDEWIRRHSTTSSAARMGRRCATTRTATSYANAASSAC